jgi:hypothetical protein
MALGYFGAGVLLTRPRTRTQRPEKYLAVHAAKPAVLSNRILKSHDDLSDERL